MKTISEINARWWYRLIKVIYIVIFICCLILPIFIIVTSYEPHFDNNKSYIECADGKNFFLRQNDILLQSDNISLYDQAAQHLCFDGVITYQPNEATTGWASLFGPTPHVVSTTKNSGKYKLVSKYTKRNWLATIGFSLLSIIVTVIVFELIKRIFYYIILGRILPKTD
jgi:hypothetical protein